MVVEQHVFFVKLARDTESVKPAVYYRVVTYARTGQWSPGDSDGFIAYSVIHHFMPVQDFDRVSFSDTVVLDSEYAIPGEKKPVSLLG